MAKTIKMKNTVTLHRTDFSKNIVFKDFTGISLSVKWVNLQFHGNQNKVNKIKKKHFLSCFIIISKLQTWKLIGKL